MYCTTVIGIALGILGLVMGSFAGATVWRLRVRQLREDIADGEKVRARDKKQVSHIDTSSLTKDRSVCLHCGHQLRWYDLIPLYSWASLGGKCRYCHKQIGTLEPLIELSMAVFFVVSYIAWPQPLVEPLEIARFAIWLASGVGLAILSIYDTRWFLLPNRVVFPLVGLGLVNAFLVLVENDFALSTFITIIDACLILAGLYYLLYVVSRHKWVGFGDVKLGLVLALMLADWQLALLTLFLANAIGTIIVVPLMMIGKLDRGAHVPFGPLLITGWFVAGLFGQNIISSYLTLVLGVS